MILKTIMKNPVLMIGILFMAIFLMEANRRGHLGKREKMVPSSCRAVRIMLDKRIPANFKTECIGSDFNHLKVEVDYQLQEKEPTPMEKLRPILYREVANYLIFIAKNSPSDNLERTREVQLTLNHKNISINAMSEGQYLAKLSTLTDKQLIAQHMKTTVLVQEIKK
ncbi:MAG: hypothetical protein Fur0010_01660 [Bdellovibrio sp.]